VKSTSIKLWVLCLGLLSPGQALASASYDDGLRAYNAGRFGEAAMLLARAGAQEPLNATVHYYLANSLVRINQHEEAIKEYRLSYLLEPKGTVSQYCLQALKSYKVTLPSGADANFVRDTIGSGKARFNNQSIAVLRRQLDGEKSRHKTIGDSVAQHALDLGEDQANAVNQQAQADITRLRTPQLVGRDPIIIGDENQIKNNAKDRQNMIMRSAKAKADRYKVWSKQKQDMLDQVAQNIEQEISGTASSKQWKMQPVGTDLYVRTYGYGRTGPPKTAQEAHPAIVRIYGQSPPPAESDLMPGNGAAQTDKTSVSGKVLK
jgi:hypothetical protein